MFSKLPNTSISDYVLKFRDQRRILLGGLWFPIASFLCNICESHDARLSVEQSRRKVWKYGGGLGLQYRHSSFNTVFLWPGILSNTVFEKPKTMSKSHLTQFFFRNAKKFQNNLQTLNFSLPNLMQKVKIISKPFWYLKMLPGSNNWTRFQFIFER